MHELSLWVSQGEIGHLNRTYVTSYSNLSSLVDSMFPNVKGDVLDATTAVLGAQATPLPATTAESISRRFGEGFGPVASRLLFWFS
jgi:hypothetical protein